MCAAADTSSGNSCESETVAWPRVSPALIVHFRKTRKGLRDTCRPRGLANQITIIITVIHVLCVYSFWTNSRPTDRPTDRLQSVQGGCSTRCLPTPVADIVNFHNRYSIIYAQPRHNHRLIV